ncbi:hypothetical protein QEH59_14185 [Coraliomargarita sp. SDUM461004]|uniref:NADH:ubiquinone oxidoreductase intermediate-associated protein 30 domain-containing protein n=1 Tax=Thalassobacterium sedimentorum TaxID=3041258 RepID=A0ABU1APQ8_9BACT|nr:hypothetical protein [Coraliomargarita sp. SDUM461004]MDQ8195578.1 hypothetical protein [Coraliomargarita sp. SDUM461004]
MSMFFTPRLLSMAVLWLSVFCIYLDAEEAPESFNIFASDAHWIFISGAEFPPGGRGHFTLNLNAETAATGVLSFDFRQGGKYVGAETKVAIPAGYQELRMQVKADQQLTLGLRLKDSTDQVHQWRMVYSNHGEWQPVRVRFHQAAPIHFGGAKDGVIHYPIRRMQLLVNRRGVTEPGEVAFTAFEILP